MVKSIQIYDLGGTDITLFILDRPWLSSKDFKAEMSEVTKALDGQIEKEVLSWSKQFDLNSLNKVNLLKNYKYKNIYIVSYGENLLDQNNNLIGYKINESECATIDISYNDNNLLCNKIIIKNYNTESLAFEGEIITTWIDIKTEFGFTRELNNTKYYYDKNNNLFNLEINYNQPQFPIYKTDSKLNEKIGTIDFETYGDNLGFGLHQVYAAGFSIKGTTKLFYIEPSETSESLVERFFRDILSNSKFNGYTFYIPNLGRFDSIFIIKSLILNKNIEITPIWKDNSILSLSIKYLNTEIILLDSLQLIPGTLENILKSFNCKIKNLKFPYKAVNKGSLFYVGKKPAKSFYEGISGLEYSGIPNSNWDLKKETLDYLKSDVEGLLEAILKFRDSIHNKYKLNITKYKTLPGLALANYTSNYSPNSLKSDLKVIKEGLERKIRTSYFGGNVEVYVNEITTGYLYDMNSQYPKAMLNDMPIGNPVLSLETDLNKIFGFVYGEITCPDESVLQVPFIQFRDSILGLNTCPRGKFKRLIFSKEIKYALKYGYSMDIEYCYQFERGKDLFKDFVSDHYEIKKKSKNPVQRNIAKLCLNSLYGRLGMNEIENNMAIMDKEMFKGLDKIKNISIVSELNNNKYLIKYSDQIGDKIKTLFLEGNSMLHEAKNIKKDEIKKLNLNKTKTTSSAVHIAAAISSYARLLINEYKNIPGNLCIMSDTDSVVLTKPLPDYLVGGEIGQLKLVHEIQEGIFIKKILLYFRY